MKNDTHELETRLDQLADLDLLDSKEALEIEAELNRRADLWSKQQKDKKVKENQYQKKMDQLLIVASGKVELMIKQFGSEFEDDYVLLDDFTVESYAKKDETLRWAHSTHKDALEKIKYLIYDRIYSRFFRNPTPQNISMLEGLLK